MARVHRGSARVQYDGAQAPSGDEAHMAEQQEQPGAGQQVEATIIPSCTERDFFTYIYPYCRTGSWTCVYCGEPIEYREDGTVYIGRQRIACRVEDLGGYYQLTPKNGPPGAVNRCCSDRISAADEAIPLGREIRCPICGDVYTCAMVTRWQGTAEVKGYVRDGRGFAVDHALAVPALVPIERLSGYAR